MARTASVHAPQLRERRHGHVPVQAGQQRLHAGPVLGRRQHVRGRLRTPRPAGSGRRTAGPGALRSCSGGSPSFSPRASHGVRAIDDVFLPIYTYRTPVGFLQAPRRASTRADARCAGASAETALLGLRRSGPATCSGTETWCSPSTRTSKAYRPGTGKTMPSRWSTWGTLTPRATPAARHRAASRRRCGRPPAPGVRQRDLDLVLPDLADPRGEPQDEDHVGMLRRKARRGDRSKTPRMLSFPDASMVAASARSARSTSMSLPWSSVERRDAHASVRYVRGYPVSPAGTISRSASTIPASTSRSAWATIGGHRLPDARKPHARRPPSDGGARPPRASPDRRAGRRTTTDVSTAARAGPSDRRQRGDRIAPVGHLLPDARRERQHAKAARSRRRAGQQRRGAAATPRTPEGRADDAERQRAGQAPPAVSPSAHASSEPRRRAQRPAPPAPPPRRPRRARHAAAEEHERHRRARVRPARAGSPTSPQAGGAAASGERQAARPAGRARASERRSSTPERTAHVGQRPPRPKRSIAPQRLAPRPRQVVWWARMQRRSA